MPEPQTPEQKFQASLIITLPEQWIKSCQLSMGKYIFRHRHEEGLPAWRAQPRVEPAMLFRHTLGRHKFNRLPFGLVASQNIFQRKLDAIFSNTNNVTGLVDDIIVSGSTQRGIGRHNGSYKEAQRWIQLGQLQFCQSKAKFYGHTITVGGLRIPEDRLYETSKHQATNMSFLLF